MNERKRLEKIVEEMGGVEKIQEELKQFTRDCHLVEWFWNDLLEEHPNEWVAVLRGRFIAYADSLEELIDSIPEEDRPRTVVRFVDTNPKPWILVDTQALLLENKAPLINSGVFSYVVK